MRKITFFLSLLLTFAGVTSAHAQSWFIDRTGWTVTAQNFTPLGSEGGASGPTEAMIDGNENSYWHSDWTGTQPGKDLPQCFTVDLGEEMELGGFAYLPRPNNGNGTIASYKVFVSSTPYDVTSADFTIPTSTPVMEGSFTYNGNTRVWKFAQSTEAFSGRYILFVSTASRSGSFATCAELQLFNTNIIGKSEAQMELYKNYISAQNTYNRQAGMPGYPAADNQCITDLSTAITNALSAANTGTETEVEEATTNLNTALSNLSNAPASISYPTNAYFTVVNSRAAITYDPTKASETDTQNGNAEYLQDCTSASLDLNNPNHLWSFIKNPNNDEYYLYNVGKKQFASSNGHGSFGDTWIFSNIPCPITMEMVTAPSIRIIGNGKTMSVSLSYTGPIITFYAEGDGGVPFTFSKSDMAVDAAITQEMEELINLYNLGIPELEAALNKASAYVDDNRIGTDLNQYSQPAEDESLVTAVSNAKTFKNAISSSTTKEEIIGWAEKLNTLVSHLVINQPEAGKFYRIRCADANMRRLLSDVADETDTNESKKIGRLTLENNIQPNSIFYFNNDQLLSYVNGQYLNEMKFAAIGNEGATVAFSDGAVIKIGTYKFKCGSRWLYGGWDDKILDSGSSEPDPTSNTSYTWWLEPVTALPVSIGSTGFATLWAPVALEIPAGVTAYTATLDEAENALVLEEVSGVIPANTGVVLKADAADNYNFNITTGGNTATSSLSGQVNTIGYDKTTDNKVYTLQTIEEGTVGFKAYNGEKLSGFKARLETTAEIQQALRLVFGGTTGIDSVAADGNNASTVFDLSGRRVAAPAKGIYIVNGKKVIFK